MGVGTHDECVFGSGYITFWSGYTASVELIENMYVCPDNIYMCVQVCLYVCM